MKEMGDAGMFSGQNV